MVRDHDPHQVADYVFAHHVDVAAPIPEVGILHPGEHHLDLFEGPAHRPLRAHPVLANDALGLLDQVHVGQHQPVGFEDAVLLAVQLPGGELLLHGRELLVGPGQRLPEAAQLVVDLAGRNPPLLHLDAAAQVVGDPDADAGRGPDTGAPTHR